MREPGLGLSALWDERDYKACGASMECRGRFILGKLFDRDTRMLKTAWLAAFGTRVLGPPEIRTDEITKTQWQVILSHMGASPDEIVDVQTRMGETDDVSLNHWGSGLHQCRGNIWPSSGLRAPAGLHVGSGTIAGAG